MSHSVVGTFSTATGNATARTLTVPAATQVGDLLYAAFYWDESADHNTEPAPTVTAPSGWTLVGYIENLLTSLAFDFFHFAYARVAQAGDASSDFTWTSNPSVSAWREAVLVVFRDSNGVFPSATPEDSDFQQSDTTTTAWTAPTSTSLTSGALHVISGSSWSGGAGAPPSGYSEAVDNASELQVGWKTLGAPGATGSLLYNAADDVWAAGSAVFEAAAVAGTTMPPRPVIVRQAVKRASSW